MVFGSSVVLRLVDRFPVIIRVGAAVLAFTAAKMIVSEPLLASLLGASSELGDAWASAVRWLIYVLAVFGVLLAGAKRSDNPTS